MNYQKKACILFICLSLFTIMLCKNDEINKNTSIINNVPNNKELLLKVNLLTKSIIDKNIIQILNLLPNNHHIQVQGGDVHKTKTQIKSSFINKGFEYVYLFDSNEYQKYFSGYSGELKTFLCIRDQLLILKKKNLRINQISTFIDDKFDLLQITHTWDNYPEPTNKINYCCYVFQLINKEWKLVSIVFHK